MKTTFRIAKNELRNLFYSPVAWFLAIVFLVMCAWLYTSMFYQWVKMIDLFARNNPYLKYQATESATQTFSEGFFAGILPNIYLFVPLLTMGVINREFTNGTIRLLYSSPVTINQIVLGKFLALLFYNLVFVLIIGFFILSAFFDIKSLDYGPLLSAVSGIYLFLSALTAIGFFMSGLTAYPVVSAIASFTVLFVLMSIGGLWQQYNFMRDLTWFLSVKNRTEKMVIGLIRTRDIIYYLVIIGMFVSFTILRLSAERGTKPWYIRTSRYLLIAVTGLLVGYTTSRPRLSGYHDTTARQVNTLHPRTQQILEQLGDSTLEVILYTNLFDTYSSFSLIGLPSSRNAYLDMWEPYVRFKPGIQFKYRYYFAMPPGDSSLYKKFPGKNLRQIAGLIAKGYQVDSALFQSPEEMSRSIDLSSENYFTVAQLKYKGRTTFLRFIPNLTGKNLGEGSFESAIDAALMRVIGVPMPRIAFVSGGLERNIYKKGEREYWAHTRGKGGLNDYMTIGSLINQGFDVDTLNLDQQDIPAGVTTLVLADPKMDISNIALHKLSAWLDSGGNMLILGEPGKQYVLNPVLQRMGVQLTNGQLVQPGANETPDKVKSYITPACYGLAEEYFFIRSQYLWAHGVYKDSLVVPLKGVTALSFAQDSGFVMQPLSGTQPGQAWMKAGRLVADSMAPVFNPAEGDHKETSFPTIIRLTRQIRGKEQRIIICGDADLASNLYRVEDMVRAFYGWLNYNRFPVYTPAPYAKDNLLLLRPGWAAAQKIIYVWVLPGILLVTGTIVLIRRKRQ